MRGVSEEHPAPFYTPAARLSLCQPKNGAGRNERTRTQTAPFQANPLGRGQLADFLSGRRRTRSLRTDLDMLVARSLKNSQLIRPRQDETQGIWETVH
jgi:hypothetical protein